LSLSSEASLRPSGCNASLSNICTESEDSNV
jgi:hypothetical protein